MQWMAHIEVEVGIHPVKGLAIAVFGGDGYSFHPFISRPDVRAEAGHIRRYFRPAGMPLCRAKPVAKQAVRVVRRGQRAAERINAGPLPIAANLLAKSDAPSPPAAKPPLPTKTRR